LTNTAKSSPLMDEERDTLTAMARLALAGQGDALADALRAVPKPRELAAAAERHGLAPIFHVFTRRAGDLPPEMAQILARSHAQNKARAIILLDEASRLMSAFEERAIPCVPLKGAALAEDLYGDPTLRPMTDVDLLVPHDALAAAREIMVAAGYEEEEGDLREDFQEEFRSEISYFRARPLPARVEIHWSLLNFGGHEAWTVEALERSVMTPRGRRLTDEDNLLYLAAHAAYHHQNDRLLWEFDIALLLQSRGADVNEDVTGDLAQRHRLLMPFRWALETGERLGVPPPPHLAAVLKKRRVGRVERWLLRFARDPQLASVVRNVLTIRGTPGWRRRGRLIAAKLFPDRKHLEVRHQARGFWPWIYTRRLLMLAGSLLLALRPKSRK
jgi:hypothetical protein